MSQVNAKTHGNELYVVKSVELTYCYPATLEDELIIKTEIELVSKARTLFHQSVLNSKNDTLICEGVVEVCYIDNDSGKPKTFPDNLLNLFKD